MLATVAVLALVTKRCPTYRRRRYGAEQQTRLPYRGAALSVPYVLEQTTKERRDRYVRISAKISTCIPRSYAESSCRSPCVLDAHVRRCMKPPVKSLPFASLSFHHSRNSHLLAHARPQRDILSPLRQLAYCQRFRTTTLPEVSPICNTSPGLRLATFTS